METKTCKVCNNTLPIEMFQIHSGTHRINKCRGCVAKEREVQKPTYTEEQLNIITNKCIRCEEEKTLVNFSKQNSNHTGYRNYCKKCDGIIRKEKRDKLRKEVNAFKEEKKCKKCGESRFFVLDFHHVNPKDKEENISRLIASGVPKKIWAEIDKTEVLCRNCHQAFHYLERTEGLTLEEYLK